MGSCASSGGCPTDYIAVAIAILALILLLARANFPFLLQKGSCIKASGFWLIIVQIIGSVNLLLSIVMSVNILKLKRRHPWQSCYVWAVWVEGPFGFGLLMSCRIVQAYQLYHVFVKRRLPPVKSYILLPVIVFPWVGGAAFIHLKKPLNHWCHMQTKWVISVVCIHGLYIAALVAVTRSVRHIEFRFQEFKDLLQGIIVSTIALGFWIAAYVLNEVHEDISWVQVSSRFFLLIMASILVLVFFSMSVSQPLLSQISLRKRESLEIATMGQALGITDSGLLMQTANMILVDPNQPLDKLLADKIFLNSFMAFADSCLAGESIHFYEEVQELSKIPANDSVRRVYMARHIIEKYIVSGAEMEVNISHRTRQEILGTLDLAHPNLFSQAVNEVMQLMKSNLAKDFWSSIYSVRFREACAKNSDSLEQMGLDHSPRLSLVHFTDNPFHQESTNKCSAGQSHNVFNLEKM